MPAAAWGTRMQGALHAAPFRPCAVWHAQRVSRQLKGLSLQRCAGDGRVASHAREDERWVGWLLQLKVRHRLVPACPVKQSIKSPLQVPLAQRGKQWSVKTKANDSSILRLNWFTVSGLPWLIYHSPWLQTSSVCMCMCNVLIAFI